MQTFNPSYFAEHSENKHILSSDIVMLSRVLPDTSASVLTERKKPSSYA